MPLIKPSQRQLDAAKMSGANLNGNIMFDTDQNALVDVGSTDENLRAGQNQGETTLPDKQKPGESKGFLSTAWNEGINNVPGLGMAKRAFTFNALPVAAGGAVGSRAGLVPGALVGIGAKMLQDKILSTVAEKHPEWQTSTEFQRSQREAAEHPWISAALQAPTSVFAGGRLLPALSKAALPSPAQAAKVAAVGTGVNLGGQLLSSGGQISSLDPVAAGIAALTSVPFAKPGVMTTAMDKMPNVARPVQDAVVNAGVKMSGKRGPAIAQRVNENELAATAEQPAEVLDEQAALAKMRGQTPQQVQDEVQGKTDYNPDFMISAPIKELRANTDPFYQEVARVRAAGVTPTPDDIRVIHDQHGARGQQPGNEIISRLQQEARGMAPSSKPPVIDTTPAKPAATSADAIKQAQAQQEATQQQILAKNDEQVALAKQAAAERESKAGVAKAVEGLTPEPTGKSAEESATAIGSRPGEVKQLDVLARNYKAKEAAVKRQLRLLNKISDTDPDYKDLLQDYMNLEQDLARDRVNLVRAGGEKLLYGEQSAVPEGYSLPKTKEPVPEAPETAPAETPAAPPVAPAQPAPVAPVTPAPKPASAPVSPELAKLADLNKKMAENEAYRKSLLPPEPATAPSETPIEMTIPPAEPKPALATAPVAEPAPVPGTPIKAAKAKPVKAAATTTAMTDVPVKKVKMVRTADKIAPGTKMKWSDGEVEMASDGKHWMFTNPAGRSWPISDSVIPEVNARYHAQQGAITQEAAKTTVSAGTKVEWAGGTAEKQGNGKWLLTVGDKVSEPNPTVTELLEKKAARISAEQNVQAQTAKADEAKVAAQKLTASALIEEAKPPTDVQKSITEAMMRDQAANEAKLAEARNKAAAEEQAKKAKETREREAKAKERVGKGLQVKINPKAGQGGFINLPTGKELKAYYREAEAKLRPAVEVLKKASEAGKHIAGKIRDAYNMQRRLEYPWINEAAENGKKYSETERLHISAFLSARHDGKPLPSLTAKEAQGVADYQKTLDRITYQKMRPDSPWVMDYDPTTGKPTARPFRVRAGWAAVNEISDKTRKILGNPSRFPDEWKVERQRYIDYLVNEKRLTLEQATELFNKQYAVNSTENYNPNPEFASLRYQEGLGIPVEWRNPDVFNALQHYAHRVATDLAYHRTLETDNVYAKATGLADNGRGGVIPSDVKLPSGASVVHGELAGDHTLNAIRRDYVGSVVPGAQGWEGFIHVVNALRFGPLTQVKDIIGSAPALAEVLAPHEIKYVNEGLKNMLLGKHGEAIRAGSVRGSRQLTPTLAEDLNSGMMKLGDLISKGTGGEQLAQAGRVFADGIGRAVARARLHEGDTAFFDKWGPSDWRNGKHSAQDIIDYVAQEVANNVGGAYNATELPAGLLRGQASFWKPLFMVQRWSIGRANRWIDHVAKPAMQGNIRPLVMSLTGGVLSAAAVNTLVQAITDRKPKELTWAEYMKLGNVGSKETMYTLLSKANTAGYAGILGNLAFSAIQSASGERPTGYNNMLYQAGTDLGGMLEDMAYAIGEGDRSWVDVLTTGTGEFLRKQSQVIRAITDKMKDETGNREEKIARRMGYIPGQRATTEAQNPFSQAAALEAGDVEAVAAMQKRKMRAGQRLSAPPMAVRRSMIMKDGQPKGYYDFIEESQGKAAKDAAFERDMKRTQKRYSIYSTALSQ